jgi:hypothetical protein
MTTRLQGWFAEHWPRVLAALLLACALLPLVHPRTSPAPRETTADEWPREWDGVALRPLAMSPLELRFAAQFPGRIARFAHGDEVLVLREVQRPTRMLHPAADCYRGLGYRIDDARLERDAQQRLWRCFIAERGGRRVRVCERIVDARGGAFTDASAWFWAATLGESVGPWRAVTRVELK